MAPISRATALLRAVVALLACVGAGCDSDSWSGALGGGEVELGSVQAAIDLGHCAAADCGPFDVMRPQVMFPRWLTCSERDVVQLGTDWQTRLAPPQSGCAGMAEVPAGVDCDLQRWQDAECPGVGACQLHGLRIALAPDGNLLAVAGFGPPRASTDVDAGLGGIVVYHQAADGSGLSAQTLVVERVAQDQALYFEADVAIDPRGHAFVAATRRLSARAVGPRRGDGSETVSRSLIEIDAQGRVAGSPIAFVDEPVTSDMVNGFTLRLAGGALALAQRRYGGGGIGLLELASRKLRWVQTRRGRLGISTMAAHADGGVSLSTRSPIGLTSGRVEHYDAEGQLAWERSWRQPTTSLLGGEFIASDGADQLFAIETLSETGVTQQLRSFAYKFNVAGEGLWASELFDSATRLTLDAGFRFGEPIWATTPTGALLFVGASAQPPSSSPARSELTAIARDGGRCGQYEWQDPYDVLEQLALGADGHVYFASSMGFGRLAFSQGDLP